MARAPGEKAKQKVSENLKKTPATAAKSKQYVVKKSFTPIITQSPPSTHSVSLPTTPSAVTSPSFVPTPIHKIPSSTTETPSDKPKKPSLKRTRSSPTFSPLLL